MPTPASGTSEGSHEVLHALEEGLPSPFDILFPSDLFSGPGSQPLLTHHLSSALSPILGPFISLLFLLGKTERQNN